MHNQTILCIEVLEGVSSDMNEVDLLTKKGKYEKSSLWATIKYYRYFYLFLFIPLVYYVVFCYLPIYGATLAFKEFRYDKGIFNSPWVGFDNITRLLKDSDFLRAFANTLIISFSRIIICFPVAIILALLLNEINRSGIKKIYQTFLTIPHFFSWIVVAGIIINLLSENGTLNQIIRLLGGNSITPLTDPASFRWVLYFGQMWKESGWDSIIFLAALSGIDPELYAAASIDGANRLQSLRHITLTGIRSTIAIMLILAIGSSITSNFDAIFNLYNPSVYVTADVLGTYVYRQAFQGRADFSYAAAAGLFSSLASLILVFSANFIIKKAFKEEGII